MANKKSNSKKISGPVWGPLFITGAIVAVSVIIAVGGIFFKTKEGLKTDRIELMADSNAKQVGPLRRVVQGRLLQDRTRLVQFATTRSTLGPGRARSFGDFALVAMVTRSKRKAWNIVWTEKGSLYPSLQKKGNMLTNKQEIALLRSLPFATLKEGEIHWQRLSDAVGGPLWAMAVAVETVLAPNGTTIAKVALPEGTDYKTGKQGEGGRAVIVGIFARNPLITATEDYIGSTSTAFVVDSRGYVASHSNKAMLGVLLRNDPSVKSALETKSSAGTTRYKNDRGTTVYSAFEQVDKTNLYTVMSTPDVVVGDSSKDFSQTTIVTGILALLVGFLMVIGWGGYLARRPQVETSKRPYAFDEMDWKYLRRPNAIRRVAVNSEERFIDLPDELKNKKATQGPNHIGGLAEEKQKLLISMAGEKSQYAKQIVDGLQATVQEPLLSAIANIQLLKSKSAETPDLSLMEEIADHAARVDRDLRNAKDIIDKLSDIAGIASQIKETDRQSVQDVVKWAISQNEPEFQAKGIKIETVLHGVPNVAGRAELTLEALSEIFINAQYALVGRSEKRIKIDLEDKGDMIYLSVSDNGTGMTKAEKAKAFDPFVRYFTHPTAKGLGLTKVRMLMQASGGEVEMTSAPGDGTTVVLKWPVLSADRNIYASQETTAPPSAELSRSTSIDFSKEGFSGFEPLSASQLKDLPAVPHEDVFADDTEEATEVIEATEVSEVTEVIEATEVDTEITPRVPDGPVEIRQVRRESSS